MLFAFEVQSLNYWTTREVLAELFLFCQNTYPGIKYFLPLPLRFLQTRCGDDGKPGAAETTGDPELWRPVSERRTAAGPGTGTGLSEPPGYRSGSVVGGRIGGQRGVREWGRLPRGPLSHPLHPHPLHPHQVPYTLRLAGASRPQTVSRRGIPTP